MQAVVHTRYGPPDVLRVDQVERPSPAGNQILVKVHATTVNRTDCGFRSAKPFLVRFFSGLLRPNNLIPGTEFAGEVVGMGGDVRTFQNGDLVFGRTEDETPGAHAEYLCIGEQEAVAHKPESLTFAQAAALCDGAMLANGYLQLVDLQRHPRVLVNGASGSIGSAAVQLAKARGAEVTAVCKTPAIDIVKSIGADYVIDYKQDDFTSCGRTFDIVFDAVGKSSLGRCKKLLSKGGYYFSTELGFMCQNPILALRTALFDGKIKVHFPIPKYRKVEAMQLKELAETGKYQPVIDRTYPLTEIVAAHTYVETGEKIGNVIVSIAH